MAETADREERTEQPTAKRLQDARDKGQVPRSRELVTTAVMLAGSATLRRWWPVSTKSSSAPSLKGTLTRLTRAMPSRLPTSAC